MRNSINHRHAVPYRVIIALLAILISNGCSRPTTTPVQTRVISPTYRVTENCDPFPGSAQPGGKITIALTEQVDPAHAPISHNVSEQLVYRNLYETLVQVACDGTLKPGLAESWRSFQDGRVWVFTLQSHAHFWDGTPVRADIVKDCWIGAQECARSACSVSPWVWLNAQAESIKALDARRLAITLPEPQADFPLLMAHPDLAVALRQPPLRWPLGTGPCRLVQPVSADGDLVCVPDPQHRRTPVWQELVFHNAPGADPRDLLESRCNAVLVRERAVLSYFQARADEIMVTALPYDRLYALLCPPREDTGPQRRWLRGWRPEELVQDVAASSARLATDLFFLPPTEQPCPQLTGPVTRLDRGVADEQGTSEEDDLGAILYPSDDEDAGRLAERIAAVAGLRPPGAASLNQGKLKPETPSSSSPPPRAEGLSARNFTLALQRGAAGAYLLPLTRCYPTACLQLAALLSRAHWLQRAGLRLLGDAGSQHQSLPPGSADFANDIATVAQYLQDQGVVVPLIMTRPYLISRGRLVGVHLAYDGTPLLDRAGWASAEESEP